MRTINDWLTGYAADHRNRANIVIHWICVPLILWSVIALLWVIPVPAVLGRAGLWAGAAIFFAVTFYLRLSRPLGFAMLIAFVVAGLITEVLYRTLGSHDLMWVAIVVFVLAWIAEFVGHKVEGNKPSFLTDRAYLLIGPAWIVTKIMRRLGVRY